VRFWEDLATTVNVEAPQVYSIEVTGNYLEDVKRFITAGMISIVEY
jgi:hypothetical protein